MGSPGSMTTKGISAASAATIATTRSSPGSRTMASGSREPAAAARRWSASLVERAASSPRLSVEGACPPASRTATASGAATAAARIRSRTSRRSPGAASPASGPAGSVAAAGARRAASQAASAAARMGRLEIGRSGSVAAAASSTRSWALILATVASSKRWRLKVRKPPRRGPASAAWPWKRRHSRSKCVVPRPNGSAATVSPGSASGGRRARCAARTSPGRRDCGWDRAPGQASRPAARRGSPGGRRRPRRRP